MISPTAPLLRIIGRLAAPAFALALGIGASCLRAESADVVVVLPVGASNAEGLPAKAAEWQKSGEASRACVLANIEDKKPAFSSIAILEFADAASAQQWRQANAGKLDSGASATVADVLLQGQAPKSDAAKAVVFVAQYQITVPPDKYREYVRGYIAPEMEGLQAKGVLTSYSVLAAHDRAGAPWDAILIMEYRDEAAAGQREAMMDAVRKDLSANNPAWKAISDHKTNVRKETSLSRSRWVSTQAN